jgi:hypothetical protein
MKEIVMSHVERLLQMFRAGQSVLALITTEIKLMATEKKTLKDIETECAKNDNWLRKPDGKPYSFSALNKDDKLLKKMSAEGLELYQAFATFRTYFYNWNEKLQKPVSGGKSKGTGVKVNVAGVPMTNKKGEILGKPAKASSPAGETGDKSKEKDPILTIKRSELTVAIDKCRAAGIDIAVLRAFLAYIPAFAELEIAV